MNAFCLSCMMNVIFIEWNMNNIKIAKRCLDLVLNVLSVHTIIEEQKYFNPS